MLLDQENHKLIEKNLALTQEILSLKGEPQLDLAMKLEELEQQLARRNQKLFGVSSEKRPRSARVDEEAQPQRGHGPREQPSCRSWRRSTSSTFPTRPAPSAAGNFKNGPGSSRNPSRRDVLERRFFRRKHKRQKYRCACQSCVETAPGPAKLTKGGQYSVETAVQVAVSKYLDHVPLERQVRIMQRQGLIVDSQTLWDQIEALASHLALIHEALHAHVLAQPVIGADETHWKLMGQGPDESKRWQVWAVAVPNAVSYRLQDSRSIEAAQHVLGGYQGTVMADGYGAYSGLQNRGAKFALAHCWAHARRKFVEIE